MSKIEWRVDHGTHIVLSKPIFMRRKVELNGQPVQGEWRSKRFDFSLPDGRAAEIALRADALARHVELRVGGRLMPDTRYVPADLRCPACNAEIQLIDEFCSKCGHALGAPDRFLSSRSVQSATRRRRPCRTSRGSRTTRFSSRSTASPTRLPNCASVSSGSSAAC